MEARNLSRLAFSMHGILWRFIQVVDCIKSLFLFSAGPYSLEWSTPDFNRLPAEEHLCHCQSGL